MDSADRLENDGKPRIGSETQDLIGALLATGYELGPLAAVLTVDDDTLRRWRRGEEASHLCRKLMQLVLICRHVCPGLLAECPGYTVAELKEALKGAPKGVVTSLDTLRRERWSGLYRVGVERGGL